MSSTTRRVQSTTMTTSSSSWYAHRDRSLLYSGFAVPCFREPPIPPRNADEEERRLKPGIMWTRLYAAAVAR
jgi:hypothetical protein